MSTRRAQDGQAVVVIAIMIVSVIGMAGLAIDAGRGYVLYRALQNAADSGALAGADQLKHNGLAAGRRAAVDYAVRNLPGTSDPGTENYGADFSGVNLGSGYSVAVTVVNNNGTQEMQVKLTGPLSVTLTQVVGAQPTIALTAGAHALSGNPPFTPAIVGLAPCGSTPYAISSQGSDSLTVNGAMEANGDISNGGSGTVTVNGNAYAVCGFHGTISYGPGGSGYPSSPRLADPGYANPQPLPTNSLGSLSLNSTSNQVDVGPGIYSAINLTGGCYFAEPGIYEFTGSGYSQTGGGFISNTLAPPGAGNLWASAGCGLADITVTPGVATPALDPKSYYLEVTATRTDGGNLRESAPSSCYQTTMSVSGSIEVSIPNSPGATGYRLYANSTGCAAPFAMVGSASGVDPSTQTQVNRGVTHISYVAGVPGAAPPSGDVANEGFAVGSGYSQVTPGAIAMVFKNAASVQHAGGSGLQFFSGYQYNWLVIWTDPANTAANDLTGGSLTHLVGTVYSPAAEMKIAGNASTSIQGQLIAWNVVLAGHSGTSITYDGNRTPSLAGRLTQ